MTKPTPEQLAQWTRLMAEAEGYSKGWYIGNDGEHEAEWMGILAGDRTSCGDYLNHAHDLNALQRVAKAICKTEEGKLLLHQHLFHWVVNPDTLDTSTLCAEVICIEPDEVFAIIGQVLEQQAADAAERKET